MTSFQSTSATQSFSSSLHATCPAEPQPGLQLDRLALDVDKGAVGVQADAAVGIGVLKIDADDPVIRSFVHASG